MLWLLVTQGDISGRQAEFEAEEVGSSIAAKSRGYRCDCCRTHLATHLQCAEISGRSRRVPASESFQ
jgi:hypothetical protein